MKGDKELEMLCCACRKPLREAGEEVFHVPLDLPARWEYPRTLDGRAIALLCARCFGRREPEFAIEWDGRMENPVYHPLKERSSSRRRSRKSGVRRKRRSRAS